MEFAGAGDGDAGDAEEAAGSERVFGTPDEGRECPSVSCGAANAGCSCRMGLLRVLGSGASFTLLLLLSLRLCVGSAVRSCEGCLPPRSRDRIGDPTGGKLTGVPRTISWRGVRLEWGAAAGGFAGVVGVGSSDECALRVLEEPAATDPAAGIGAAAVRCFVVEVVDAEALLAAAAAAAEVNSVLLLLSSSCHGLTLACFSSS